MALPVFASRSRVKRQLLLVLWKTLLACCGGMKDLNRVKKLAREVAGLPLTSEGGPFGPSDPPSFDTSADLPSRHQYQILPPGH